MIADVVNPGDPDIEFFPAAREVFITPTPIKVEKVSWSTRLKLTPYSSHSKIFAIFPLFLALCISILNLVVINMIGHSLLQNALTAALIYTSLSIGLILVIYTILLSRADARAREAAEHTQVAAERAQVAAEERAREAAMRAREAAMKQREAAEMSARNITFGRDPESG
jgi:hypothetical protein